MLGEAGLQSASVVAWRRGESQGSTRRWLICCPRRVNPPAAGAPPPVRPEARSRAAPREDGGVVLEAGIATDELDARTVFATAESST